MKKPIAKKPAVKKTKKEKTPKKPAFRFESKKIPHEPGCYLFWDETDHLLYVGKAKDLRKRVSSYFQKSKDKPARTELLVKKIARIETRIVRSEMEAMILENNLIKEFQPRFNVRLRDDKNFVYLRITRDDEPKMEIVRRFVRDGAVYIGPKTATHEFRETVRFCQKFWRVKMVKESQNYYPHVISGEQLSPEKYRENIEQMKKFLRGDTSDILKILQEKMMRFASEKNFEAAAKVRDTIKSIQASTQKQLVEFSDALDRDFVNFVQDGNKAYVVRIAFRGGKLLDQTELVFDASETVSESEILEAFLLQFYEKVTDPPHEICLPNELENKEEIEKFLSETFFEKKKIDLCFPQKGDKKQVLDLARKNAENFAEKTKLEALSHAENFANALPELAEALGLTEPPRRIECYDISHFSGDAPVASQVVFMDGEPKTSEYRRFHVKSLPEGHIDDFASLQEVLQRRFARVDDQKFAAKHPDLIIIDGGKGQLSSVMKIFEKDITPPESFDPEKQIIALAKREEEIFRVGNSEPLVLDPHSSALKLLQRIRDEAHRFAITFNRNVRKKSATKSLLDEVPGIGNTTRKKLVQKFGSVAGVREAKDAELLSILSAAQLQNLRKKL